MKIAIGCDHGGYLLKQDILIWLEEHNIDFEDVGCYSTESVDYPMYGEKVGRMVASGQCDKASSSAPPASASPLRPTRCGASAALCAVIPSPRK